MIIDCAIYLKIYYMMKALFVSRDYTLKRDGGSAVVKRNLFLLKQSFDEVVELCVPIPSLFTRCKNILFRESYGNTLSLKKEVIKHLNNTYDLVFFDSSLYGGYLKLFAKKGFNICCFYHNVEYKYYLDKYNLSRKLQDRIMLPYIRYNELLSTNYATFRVTLNERDSSDLMKMYGKKANFLLPTSFDSLDVDWLNCQIDTQNIPYILFVGSNFYANVEGMEFFIKKVAPYIKYNVKIVGNVCEVFKHKNLPSNVLLIGMVDDLTSYYVNALCVIAPIFSGSGLKTKTIEAFRYGKRIIGTKESFVGVPREYYSIIGEVCSTAGDFIESINSLSSYASQYINLEILDLFNKLYSNQAIEKKFKDFLIANSVL